ncbi:MAG: ASKHA domain-containing protein [Thermodesulfobacteriota bacterium]
MELIIRPFGRVAHVTEGSSLLSAVTAAKISLRSDCGGAGRCGKCRIIAKDGLSPITEAEKESLTPKELRQGIRLACQAQMIRPAEILVPPGSVEGHIKILVEGMPRSLKPDPSLKRTCFPDLALKPPKDLCWEAFLTEMDRGEGTRLSPTLHLLRQLAQGRGSAAGELALLTLDGNAVSLERTAGERVLGLAVDVGTTTIVGYLADLLSGKRLSYAACPNPQIRYGADVVSRIQFGAFEGGGLRRLQDAVTAALNDIAAETARKAGALREHIYEICAVGNTTMHHLLLGIRPASLSRFPYQPVIREGLTVPAREVGLAIHPQGRIYLPPLISGFMGSDTVAVVLATRLHESRSIKLAIDFGTNGEVVLGNRDRLVATSCAAGPAFEGSHIAYGMTGSSGAIDAVAIDAEDQVHVHTLDDYPAVGMCGSGLVAAVSELRRKGIIDPSGRLLTKAEVGRSPLAHRLTRQRGQAAFLLFEGENGRKSRKIYLIQKDVRELQLAKSAVRAGIQVLMTELGIEFGDLREVLLAGAFGNYVDPDGAIGIGLLPHFERPKIKPVGNAAGVGAQMALLSMKERGRAQEIARAIEYVDLAKHPAFQEEFIRGMAFPDRD